MQAIAVIPRQRTIQIIDHPDALITEPHDVMLKMLDIGICGTDKEICCFEYGTPPKGFEHLVIGHESLGEVVAVGSAVSQVKPGDLVVPTVRRPCSHTHCLACRAGRPDFCYTGDITERGIKEAHGYMTEYVVDHEDYMNVLPSALRDVGVLVEPLTIAEKAISQIWQVQSRLPWACPVKPGEKAGSCHSALVLGAGPVGLLGAMALQANGFNTYVYSRGPATDSKALLVTALGATYLSGENYKISQLPERIGNIDVVYEAVGASRLSFEVMEVLGINGIFVFTGVPGRKDKIEVDTDLLMRNLVLKNQVIFGTVNASKESYQAAIRDLGYFNQTWPQALRQLITGRFPIDEYADLLLGRPSGIKNVISFDHLCEGALGTSASDTRGVTVA